MRVMEFRGVGEIEEGGDGQRWESRTGSGFQRKDQSLVYLEGIPPVKSGVL